MSVRLQFQLEKSLRLLAAAGLLLEVDSTGAPGFRRTSLLGKQLLFFYDPARQERSKNSSMKLTNHCATRTPVESNT